MKDNGNEWVSIGDLMASVVAVVMLLLVVSVLQQTYAEIKYKEELSKSVANQKVVIENIFNNMKESLKNENLESLAEFNFVENKISFKDGLFERGSAIITPKARKAFLKSQDKIVEFLKQVPNGKILVEGHTDNLPVLKPVIDIETYGAVYDDNFTLSAARAREARKHIIGTLDKELANRIIVTGYGDSCPVNKANPSDAANRRVEIRFTIDTEK